MKFRNISGLLALLLCFLMMCTACGSGEASVPAPTAEAAAYSRFSRMELSVFDTVITLSGFAPSQADFNQAADGAMALMRQCNQIFDAYNGYGDLHNLWYVNLHAAEGPVEVPNELFDLLSWCRAQWEAGYRKTNVAMGAVLSIWHDYRTAGSNDPENAQLPPLADLQSAALHTDFEQVVLDAQKRTVYFADPLLKLDIGAVAKGYAADVANEYLSRVMPSYLLSLGGNVYAGTAPMDGRANWGVGVQDPRIDAAALAAGGTDILDVLDVHSLSVVTSGDYWRYYVVDGQRYHHIIDPDTLYPSTQMMSVTVVCESSLLADFLSTTLFILPYEEGLALAEGLDGVEAMWVLMDGSIQCTPGMIPYSRTLRDGGGA